MIGSSILKGVFERERKATGIACGNYEVSVQRLRGRSACNFLKLGCGHEAVSHGIFHQIGGGMQVEHFHDLGFVKFDGAMGDL